MVSAGGSEPAAVRAEGQSPVAAPVPVPVVSLQLQAAQLVQIVPFEASQLPGSRRRHLCAEKFFRESQFAACPRLSGALDLGRVAAAVAQVRLFARLLPSGPGSFPFR